MNKIILATLLLAGASSSALAAPGDPTIVIQNVQVFDGEQTLGKRTILIADGKIADPDFKDKAPAGAAVVDGSGKTLLPGLIDAHVHAFGEADTPLLFGVTTQLDMFTPPAANAKIKADTKTGSNIQAADLYSSGMLATAPGGHGTQFGVPVPTLTKPEEADAWVAARIAEGSDYIKIVSEDGSSFGSKLPTLDFATIKALVDAAHRQGKIAVVHVQSYAAASDAINAGADGLVHLFIDRAGDAALAELAKKHQVFVTPTMTVFESFAGRAGSASLLTTPGLAGLLSKQAESSVTSATGPDRAAALDAYVKASVTALTRAGVPILAGTDSGNPGTWYGISLHRELDLLVKAGLTPAQALTAATAAPAKAYRLTDRGRIAKGMIADLLLVEGDPTQDIGAVHNIAEIWKRGHAVSALRAARRSEIAKANAAPAGAAIALPADGRVLNISQSAGGKLVMKAAFGSGWNGITDRDFGGGSNLVLALSGAAPGGQPALLLSGEVKQGGFFQWSGIGFLPGDQPFAPANLSAASALKFWIRGEGPGFGTMAFSQATGQRPVIAPFKVGKDWAEVTVKFTDLNGFDPATAMMLTITALQPGPFRIEVADVRLVKQ